MTIKKLKEWIADKDDYRIIYIWRNGQFMELQFTDIGLSCEVKEESKQGELFD